MSGYFLSDQGLSRLVEATSNPYKMTREEISLCASLDPKTITKVWSRKKPVYLRTILNIFNALELDLNEDRDVIKSDKKRESGESEDSGDYTNNASTNKFEAKGMGQNQDDYQMLIGLATELEEAANNVADEKQKQKMLKKAQEARDRAAQLPK